MPLGKASEELERKRTQITRLQPLYDRMDRHFDLWTQKQFKIPRAEGKWDSITSNSAAVLGNGIIDKLAASKFRAWIPLVDEDKKQRKPLRNTELLVNAAFQLNDDRLLMVPEAVTLQAALAWQAAIRAVIGLRVFVFKDSSNNVIFDMAPWDPRHISWVSGGAGNPLPWVCFERWASVDEIKAQYGNDAVTKAGAEVSKDGHVLVSDIWNNMQEGVIVGGSSSGSGKGRTQQTKGDYVHTQNHDIGHPPVLVLPCGSAPFVQSDKHTDSIEHLGSGAYINNEHLYEPFNRERSYRMTLLKTAAKTGNILEYDSTFGNPPEVAGDPTEAGATVVVDVSKGQKWLPGLQPQMSRDADVFDGQVRAELDTGGMAPIAHGVAEQGAQTFGGINLLTDAALQRLNVARKSEETALEWAAGEAISQFKTADFGKVTMKGLETSNKAFEIQVSKKDIDDSWRVKVKLMPDLPQNEQIIAAVATQLKGSGLISDRNIQERYQLVEDFDLNEEQIDLQAADEIAGIKMRRIARAILEEGGPNAREQAMEILDFLDEQDGQRRQRSQGGQAVQPGIPIPASPAAGLASRTEAPGRAGLRSMISRLTGR